jgi:hypothetical protein
MRPNQNLGLELPRNKLSSTSRLCLDNLPHAKPRFHIPSRSNIAIPTEEVSARQVFEKDVGTDEDESSRKENSTERMLALI